MTMLQPFDPIAGATQLQNACYAATTCKAHHAAAIRVPDGNRPDDVRLQ